MKWNRIVSCLLLGLADLSAGYTTAQDYTSADRRRVQCLRLDLASQRSRLHMLDAASERKGVYTQHSE